MGKGLGAPESTSSSSSSSSSSSTVLLTPRNHVSTDRLGAVAQASAGLCRPLQPFAGQSTMQHRHVPGRGLPDAGFGLGEPNSLKQARPSLASQSMGPWMVKFA